MKKIYLLSVLIVTAPMQAGISDLAESAVMRTIEFVGDHPIVFGSAVPLIWFGVPGMLVRQAKKLIKTQKTIESEARELLTKLGKKYESLLMAGDSPIKPENIKLFAASFQKQYRDHEANWAEKFHSNVTATYNKLGHYPLIFLMRHLKQDVAAAQWYASHSKDAECKAPLQKMGQSLQSVINLIHTTELFAQEQANVIQEKNRSYINVPVFLALSFLGGVITFKARELSPQIRAHRRHFERAADRARNDRQRAGDADYEEHRG